MKLINLQLVLILLLGLQCCENQRSYFSQPLIGPWVLKWCGSTFYYENNDICCGGTTARRYDHRHGVIDHRTGFRQVWISRNVCCSQSGSTLIQNFNHSTHICCEDRLQPKEGGRYTDCCGTISYDTRQYSCCKTGVQPIIYNLHRNVCCSAGSIQPRVQDYATHCCGSISFDIRRAVCCNGVVNQKNVTGLMENYICCGNVAHYTATNGPGKYCCGSNAYDPSKSVCCNTVIQPIRGSSQNTYCCGTTSYHLYGSQICCDGVLQRRQPGSRFPLLYLNCPQSGR